jgi:hypothetical protein
MKLSTKKTSFQGPILVPLTFKMAGVLFD